MAKSIVSGIVEEITGPKRVVPPPPPTWESVVGNLPDGTLEGDMEWAYKNIGIEKPDWVSAPSRSCRFIWEYARSARSEFLTRYMALRAKTREAEVGVEADRLSTLKSISVIDALIAKLGI